MAQSPAELMAHLDEQLAFIDSSCEAFDRGVEFECKRLASHVRTLVHDTEGSSTSLLTHLGVKTDLWFYDWVVDQRERYAVNRAAGGVPLFVGGLVTIELGSAAQFVAKARAATSTSNNQAPQRVPFEVWWREQALFPMSGPPPTRRSVMHWLAHKDGGSHVDRLPASYVALTTGEAMGITFPRMNPQPQNSPIPAAMRQIAEELRTSLREQFELIRTTAGTVSP